MRGKEKGKRGMIEKKREEKEGKIRKGERKRESKWVREIGRAERGGEREQEKGREKE